MIVNPKGKIYIGQSIDIDKRFATHKNIKINNHTHIHRSISKYGADNHEFSIIEECEISELNMRERYWQDYYEVLRHGLNSKLTETDDKSGELSNDTKNKIAESLRGVRHSAERIDKNRISNTGKKLSVKAIEKLKLPKGSHAVIECPKCSKSGGSHSMKRYHFENCGKNTEIKKHKCSFCDVMIGGISNLLRHEKSCKNSK